jgi:hypothetical protein
MKIADTVNHAVSQLFYDVALRGITKSISEYMHQHSITGIFRTTWGRASADLITPITDKLNESIELSDRL